MARKTEGGNQSNSRTAAAMSSLRHQIDKLDQQILRLINDRAKVAVDIGKIKQDNSSDTFSPAREEEVIQNISGLINPGPESIKLTKATMEPSFDPKGWTVHFEADAKDHDGKPVHFMIDGKIENLTSIRRSIVGTWNHGGVKGDFKITRDQ